jgi:hypothetical protein
MNNTQPFVAAALICERVLQEKDGVLSAIRIVDTFTIARDELPTKGAPRVLGLSVLVILKSGALRGQSHLSLTIRDPDGKRNDLQEWPVLLNGDENAAQLVLNLALGAEKLGLYWVDVVWEGNVLSSIPFRLREAPA